MAGSDAAAAATTPLGALRAALTSAAQAQLRGACDRRAQALGWAPAAAALGRLPCRADFEAACSPGADGDAASEASAATSLADVGGSYHQLEARIIASALPEGCQPVAAQRAAAAAAAPPPALQEPGMAEEPARVKCRREALRDEAAAVEAALQGSLRCVLLPPEADAAAAVVCMECVAPQPPGSGAQPGAVPAWKRLRLLVPERYPEAPPVVLHSSWGGGGGASGGSADAPGGAGGAPLDATLADEAWAELSAALWEAPATDLAGLAQHWRQAVDAVCLQHSLQA